jgi:two-component system sensor histidine kinase GlrK
MFPAYPRSLARLVLIGFALSALPLTGTVIYAVAALESLAARGEAAANESARSVRLGREIADRLTGLERLARQHAVIGDAHLVEDYRQNRSAWQQALAAFGALPLLSPLAPEAQRLTRDAFAFGEPFGRVDSATLGRKLEATEGRVQALLDGAQALTEEAARQLREDADLARIHLVILALAAVMLAALTAAAFRRLIARQMSQFDEAVGALGDGRYGEPIVVAGTGDLAEIGERLEWLRRRLRELEQQRERFLRHVSHDLKTPLATLREGTQLLADGIGGDLASQQRRIVNIMLDNATRLQRMIDGLLRMQQAGAALGGIRPLPFRLDAVCRQVLANQQLPAKANDIRLLATFDETTVEGDGEMVRAMVDNLVSNAIKYSTAGGTVRMALQQQGEAAIIEVADEGPGIPAADRERIFDLFWRGANARQTGIEGSGVGLAIGREVTEAHGGNLELIDSPVGARFRVTLPLTWKRHTA